MYVVDNSTVLRASFYEVWTRASCSQTQKKDGCVLSTFSCCLPFIDSQSDGALSKIFQASMWIGYPLASKIIDRSHQIYAHILWILHLECTLNQFCSWNSTSPNKCVAYATSSTGIEACRELAWRWARTYCHTWSSSSHSRWFMSFKLLASLHFELKSAATHWKGPSQGKVKWGKQRVVFYLSSS